MSKVPIIVSDNSNDEHNATISMKDTNLDSKLSQNFFSQAFSASEAESESDISESDSEENIDPNDTIELEKTKRLDIGEDDNKFRGRPSSCIFVASLAASLTDDELSLSVTKHFQQWGELALVKVLRDPSNRPYAFVQYTNDKDANSALREGQHSILDGRAIRCEKAKVNRTLYIATSDGKDISLKELKETLDEFGEIEQMTGNNDSPYRKSNLNKAWFCKFAYRDDAIRSYANLRLSPDWIVEWAQNIEQSDSTEKSTEPEVMIDKLSIFIGQLDDKVTKEKLDERFSRHGKISEITLVLRPGNNFAFIKFETEKAAAAAVERENHAVFLDKTMHVQYRELHHKRSRYSSASSTSPRLNLAPPPVNLPYRRASTGSGFGNRQNSVSQNIYQPLPRQNRSKYPSSRSVSFGTGERVSATSRYHTPVYGFPPVFNEPKYNDDLGTAVEEDIAETQQYSPSQKHSPLSSPSVVTTGSPHGELKSAYSSSTMSNMDHAGNDDITDPTTSGHSTSKYKYQAGRKFSAVPPASNHHQLLRPPSSYYYYPAPPTKDGFAYDQPQYLAYGSYPFYFNDSYVDFSQAPVAASAHGIAPAPYYMYYGVAPGTGYTDPKVKPYEKFDHHVAEPTEMDY